MSKAKQVVYQQLGQWAHTNVYRSDAGWIVEHHSAIQGTRSATRVLVPYDTDMGPEADLDAGWNDYATVGDRIIYMTGAPNARTLRKGYVIQ